MSQPTYEPAWHSAPMWSKFSYGLGALILGLPLALIPAFLIFLIDSLLAESTDADGVVAWTARVSLLVAIVPATMFFYWAMRDDYNYVHSPEYAGRNPEFAAECRRCGGSAWFGSETLARGSDHAIGLPAGIEGPRGRRWPSRWAIAVAGVFLIVLAGSGWLWQERTLSELHDDLDAQTAMIETLSAEASDASVNELASDIDSLYEYVDKLDAQTAMIETLSAEAPDARIDELASDMDSLYEYVDDLSLRQESMERVVQSDPGWDPIEEMLEESVVRVLTDYSQGSGFRLDIAAGCFELDCGLYEAEGYDAVIVTNYHVIAELAELEYPDRIVTPIGSDGSIAEGRVWDWDRENDLALIDVDRSDFEPALEALKWPPVTEPRVSDPVAIGGHPLGWDFTMTTGQLSEKDSNAWLALGATISGGSSGSPVVDVFGRVIGVATALDGPTTWIVEIEALCDQLVEC